MKNLFGLVLLLTISLSSLTSIYAQGPDEYWIGLEEYAVHTNGDLEGMTTWRMYLHMLDEDDYLSACTGSDSLPLFSNRHLIQHGTSTHQQVKLLPQELILLFLRLSLI